MRLQPQLGEARLALTHCYLWGEGDYDRALAELAHGRAIAQLRRGATDRGPPSTRSKQIPRSHRRFYIARETLDPREPHSAWVVDFHTSMGALIWPEALHSFARKNGLRRDEPIYSWWWWSRENDEFRAYGDINTLTKSITEAADGPRAHQFRLAQGRRYETAMLARDTFAKQDDSSRRSRPKYLAKPPLIDGRDIRKPFTKR